MKHLFYCLFLMLLCVGCKGEDDPMIEEENDSLSATTRASGSLDLSLSGNVVSISWNKPFGVNVGIEVGVSAGSGMSLGSFSSSNDFGSELFFLSSIASYSGPVTATVRGRSSSGYIVGQPMTISLGNVNMGQDPTIPPRCNHLYNPIYPSLGISLDNYGVLRLQREFSKAGLLVYVFHVQSFSSYDQYAKPVYDVADFANRVNLPALNGHTSAISEINLGPDILRFLNRTDATFSLEVRIYDGECPKLDSSNIYPECTNYCMYKVTNLEPLRNISRTVTMWQIRQ